MSRFFGRICLRKGHLRDIAAILHVLGLLPPYLAALMANYVSVAVLLSVAFGYVYRAAAGGSRTTRFSAPRGILNRLDFSNAPHFSLVTLSNLGYGDTRP